MSTLRITARTLARISVGALAALLLVAPASAKPKGDGDGMPTGWERRNGLNVHRNDSRRDPDSDLLRNLGEFQSGTDPQDPDSDGDGIPDGEEVVDGTDPTDTLPEGETEEVLDPEDLDDGDEPCGIDDPDSEGDGIDNEDEDELGGDVTDPDSDGDGIIDGLEDSDQDGETDLVEEQVTPDVCSNHGAAVRTAAHCPVHGRAHGKLVSSIARDKSATVESAVAACAEALGLDVVEEPPVEEPPAEEPPAEEPPAEEPPAEEPPA
ncbi:MAG: hypothetical protein ACRDHM_06945 [Actinomycetota bacterium]